MSKELERRADIGKSFERMKGEWFYTYRGVTFEKVPVGWKWGESVCRNRQEMDSLIDQMEQQLANSIKSK